MANNPLDQYLLDTLVSAPELQHAPGVAVPTAQQSSASGNTKQNAHVVAHVANMNGHAQARADIETGGHKNALEKAFGWIGRHLRPVTASGTPTIQGYQQAKAQGATQQQATIASLGKPVDLGQSLREVQHQYRTIRDVYQTEGVVAGLAATAAIGGGAALGSWLGPEGTAAGAILGGEAVGAVEDRTVFQKSWDRTENGDAYRDAAGRQVSPGRDLAVLGSHVPVLGHFLREGSLGHSALSAIGDGVFDVGADPLAAGLKVGHAQIASEDAVLHGPEAVDKVLADRPAQAQRVFSDIAGKNAAEIYRDYPQFRDIALDLERATTADDVANTLRDALQGPELRTSRLPYFRQGDRPTGTNPSAFDTAVGSDDPITRLQAARRRLTEKLPMSVNRNLDFTASTIDPTAADAPEAFARLMKFSRMSDRTVDAHVNDFIHEQNTGMRRLMIANAKVRMAMSMGDLGATDTGRELLSRLRQDVFDQQGGVGGAEGNHFGTSIQGDDLSRMPNLDGDATTAAIWLNQRGDIPIPQYRGFVRAIRETQGAKALFGRVDDWGNRVITPFKKVALLTGGFALRVATAEAIPAVFRNGVSDTIEAALSAKAGKLGRFAADADEVEQIKAATVAQLHGPRGFISDPRLVERAIDLNYANGGLLPAGMGADEYVTAEHIGRIEADRLNMHKLTMSSPTRDVETGEFADFGSGHSKFPLYWQRAIREVAGDQGGRIAAAAYRDAYLSAGRETVDAARAGGFIDTTSRATGAAEPAALPAGATPTETGAAVEPAPTAEQAAGGRTAKYADDELVKIATRAAIKADEQFLRSLPEKLQTDFKRSALSGTDDIDPIRSWARVRVEALKGLTHAPTRNAAGEVVGAPHLNVLDDIANGKTTDIDTLQNVKTSDRPINVKGRLTAPMLKGNVIDRLANVAWKRIFDPIIATVAREHQYLIAFDKYMTDLDPLVKNGQLAHEDAVQLAQVKTIRDVARFIHNPAERTQFSELARVVAPFYFAQEQSYRRAGRVLADDPAAFRRYQIVSSSFANMVSKQKDEHGNSYALIPGLGFLDEIASQGLAHAGITPSTVVPIQVLGSTSSLNTVFPLADINGEGLRPSWSPFVTVPAHIISALLPEAKPQLSAIAGGPAVSGSVWDQLIPSTPLRNLVHAFTGSTDDQTIASGAAQVFVALAYRQQVAMTKWVAAGHAADDKGAPQIVPGPNASPMVQKRFIERVRGQARVNQVFRAIVSAASPLSPKIDVGDYGIKQEIQTYIDKYGVSDGIDRYLAKNPDASPYTISMTSSADNAPAVNPTRSAQQFVNDNAAMFTAHPAAAGYLIPQDTTGKYDPAVYQEQIALGLRNRKGLGDIEKDFYINEGFAQYDVDQAAHQAAVASLADDKDAIKTENANWSDYLNNVLGAQNKVWWDYFTSTDRDNRRKREVTDLRSIIADPATPGGPMKTGIGGLLADLDAHLNALDEGSLDNWTREDRQTELDNWQAYLEQVKQEHPELKVVITRLFAHLGAR